MLQTETELIISSALSIYRAYCANNVMMMMMMMMLINVIEEELSRHQKSTEKSVIF